MSRFRPNSALLLGLLLLVTLPLSLLAGGGHLTAWAEAKAALGLIALALGLAGARRGGKHLAGHRWPRGAATRLSAGLAAALLAAGLLLYLAERSPLRLELSSAGVRRLAPELLELLAAAPGPVSARVVYGGPEGYREQVAELLVELRRRSDNFNYSVLDPAQAGELAAQAQIEPRQSWLLLRLGKRQRPVLLQGEPQAALATGLAALLGMNSPPVVHPPLPGLALAHLDDGKFLLLALVCQDLLPLLLLAAALFTWRRRPAASPPPSHGP